MHHKKTQKSVPEHIIFILARPDAFTYKYINFFITSSFSSQFSKKSRISKGFLSIFFILMMKSTFFYYCSLFLYIYILLYAPSLERDPLKQAKLVSELYVHNTSSIRFGVYKKKCEHFQTHVPMYKRVCILFITPS